MEIWPLEVEYIYQRDKSDTPQTSWTYYHVEAKDLASAKEKVKKLFKKTLTEVGWTRYTTLVEIRRIRQANETPPTIITVPYPTPKPSPSRRSRSKGSSATTGNKRPVQNERHSGKRKTNRKDEDGDSTNPKSKAKGGVQRKGNSKRKKPVR